MPADAITISAARPATVEHGDGEKEDAVQVGPGIVPVSVHAHETRRARFPG